MKAINIRNRSQESTISTEPGLYRWYMPKGLVNMLNVPIHGCVYKEGLGYFVYVGIVKNMKQRLDWHISQRHTLSSIRSGFLSTLRQTLAALAHIPMDDEKTVNEIIDQMAIEYEVLPTKEDAEVLEKKVMKDFTLPLNIMHNDHPFRKELKRLRSVSKKKCV